MILKCNLLLIDLKVNKMINLKFQLLSFRKYQLKINNYKKILIGLELKVKEILNKYYKIKNKDIII